MIHFRSHFVLHPCFYDNKQHVINKQVLVDIVLDVGIGNKIVDIEILDASKYVNLERLLPVKSSISQWAA